jgi:hypothetical protein
VLSVACLGSDAHGMLSSCSMTDSVPLRQACCHWRRAAHAGHCIDDATAQYIVKAADPLDLAQKASHLHMDDYGPAPAPEPYRPGKNMVQQQAKGGRRDLFDVLRGRCVRMRCRAPAKGLVCTGNAVLPECCVQHV